MALDFGFETRKIPQTTGAFSATESIGFDDNVRTAEVCVKSFKLDRVSGSTPSDIVQVTVRLQRVSGKTVEYEITTNYSGGPYTGEVTVLAIADVESHP
jgi:hypothetical protein